MFSNLIKNLFANPVFFSLDLELSLSAFPTCCFVIASCFFEALFIETCAT